MHRPHVHVILSEDNLPPTLHAALDRVGAVTSFASLPDELRSPRPPRADAVVVVSPRAGQPQAERLGALLTRMAGRPRATLVLNPERPLHALPSHPRRLPVSFGTALSTDELTARLTTMIEMRHSLATLSRSRRGPGRPEHQLAEHYARQVRRAGYAPADAPSRPLPRFGRVSFSAVYRPLEGVSGDFYDIRRLDETHVGVALADVTGHGLSAATLTVLVKRALHGTDPRGRRPRPAAEVLTALNQELLESDLPDCHFAAIAYALIDTARGVVNVARGGAPYPILRRRGGARQLLRSEGPVVGVLPGAQFTEQTATLAEGDALLLYTDGLERVATATEADLVPSCGTTPPFSAATDAAVPPDELIRETAWYEQLGGDLSAAMAQAGERYDVLRRLGQPLDDLTALAIRMD